MLRSGLCFLLLLLPGIAAADSLSMSMLPGQDVAGTEDDATGEHLLDISPEPLAPTPTPQLLPIRRVNPAPRAKAPEAPFTVGLDFKTRREVGDEAKEDATNLVDEVTGIVERSTFGLTGTYRF